MSSKKNIDWENIIEMSLEKFKDVDLSDMDYEAKNHLMEALYNEYLIIKKGNNTQTLLVCEKMLSTLIKTYGH